MLVNLILVLGGFDLLKVMSTSDESGLWFQQLSKFNF